MSLTADQRNTIKYYVDLDARRKMENGYMNCDPEFLSVRADEAEQMGFVDEANALRNFRDNVVNTMLGEGISLERIEAACLRHFKGFR